MKLDCLEYRIEEIENSELFEPVKWVLYFLFGSALAFRTLLESRGN